MKKSAGMSSYRESVSNAVFPKSRGGVTLHTYVDPPWVCAFVRFRDVPFDGVGGFDISRSSKVAKEPC